METTFDRAAFAEGYDAYYNEFAARSDNPYNYNDEPELYDAWNAGWRRAAASDF